MFEKLLRAKHWGIFVLGFVIPMAFFMCWYIYFIVNLIQFSEANQGSAQPPEEMINMISSGISFIFPLMALLSCVLYAWFWSMGVSLQKYLHPVCSSSFTYFYCLVKSTCSISWLKL